MAKMNNKAIFNLVLMLSFLLIISMAEGSRLFGSVEKRKAKTLVCDTVLGVQIGDTCFDIIQKNGLTAEDFGAINPNLNCDALFEGQWLCIAGTA